MIKCWLNGGNFCIHCGCIVVACRRIQEFDWLIIIGYGIHRFVKNEWLGKGLFIFSILVVLPFGIACGSSTPLAQTNESAVRQEETLILSKEPQTSISTAPSPSDVGADLTKGGSLDLTPSFEPSGTSTPEPTATHTPTLT